MECLRYGQCCTTATIILGNVEFNSDVNELGKWLEFHRCSLEEVVSKDGESVLGVRIPLTCKYLGYDPDTGLAFCKVYSDRPAICKGYFCKRCKNVRLDIE